MGQRGNDQPKKYEVGLDVLASAGYEALNRLAEDGNTVYFDFREVERRALDPIHRQSDEYQQVLRWANKLNIVEDRSGYETPSGGVIRWEPPSEEEEREVTFITRSPGLKSMKRREGRHVSFPDFLKFSGTGLSSGLIELDDYCHGTKDVNVDKVLEASGLERLFPHQYIRIHGSVVYGVTQNLSKDRGRPRLTGEPTLERFQWEGNINSRLPSLEARNLEQRLAFAQLTHPDVEISFLTGESGSGKTVIAYGAGVHLLLGKKDKERTTHYDGIVIFKSNDIIGGKARELGFLPGSAEEKMAHHLKSYKDAHNLSGANQWVPFEKMLVSPREAARKEGLELPQGKEKSRRGHVAPNAKIGDFWLPTNGPAVEIEHLQYAQGRTFENKIVIVDEAQNYTPFEMKQLIERVGMGSKIFLVGDPQQVINPSLAPDFNGLVFAADTFFEKHPRVSFMELDQNYRSQSAEIMRKRRAPRNY